ncbi:SRPBCC family protein [Candidatus Leptofilum sp.]|uniref:SRPBCC family protein n=1 Tax=Candidatus Leptofilum sp. TaxID=3241576 RepID=UPI003B5C1D35
MPVFDYKFTVDAPVTAVSNFHHDARILKKLSPPPIFVQIHHFEPLDEGSEAQFTLWLGPLPLRWLAVHSNVSPNGFTDMQIKGPLAHWQHTHRFTAVSLNKTEVHEHIQYSHKPGLVGLLTRILFNKPGLWGLFTIRKLLTRWHVRQLLSAPAYKEEI